MIRFSIFIVLLFIHPLYSIVPLSSSPSWTSIDNDYSTGAGFADINNDGFIDFWTSNGNDMALNKQAIYYNNNGNLETQASWRSQDSGMFGHLYIGDINNDGNLDMAVAYLGPQGDCKTRIYKNTGTTLTSLPYWLSSDTDTSFDCALGDVDLDGDLDLAVTAGDAYTSRKSPAKIYRNHNGLFENLPFWIAGDSTPSDAIRFADFNRDGYLDLIVGYRRKLSVFYNQNGTLETTASWSIAERGWILRIAPADYDNDGWLDVAIAVNGQLSGDSSRIKVFKNNQGQLNTIPSFTMLKNRRYCSCVEWGDVNNDGYLDLSAGGWWEPIVVFENRNGILDTLPTWSWSGGNSLVCEAIVWGDVRNHHLRIKSDTFISNGIRKLYYTSKRPWQYRPTIMVQGVILPLNNYCYDMSSGWVTLRNTPIVGETIIIQYHYSAYPDLAVTNWTSSVGNYLFYNTTPSTIVEDEMALEKNIEDIMVYPNPFRSEIKIQVANEFRTPIKIYNSSGKLVRTISSNSAIWNGKNDLGNSEPSGIYFIEVVKKNEIIKKKVVKLND
ncbi:MAG: T9SS type A sorting domain-containing protein [candidate division WOR-3 bacterium]|nr:T9SS type A sorting domain-containing protein [candidate division WOR-3 bacterium]